MVPGSNKYPVKYFADAHFVCVNGPFYRKQGAAYIIPRSTACSLADL